MLSSASTQTARFESDAIARAKLGDVEAFEFLYHLYKRQVYALCVRMAGDRVAAESLAREVFLHTFRSITAFGGEIPFSLWLHGRALEVVGMRRARSIEEPLPGGRLRELAAQLGRSQGDTVQQLR